VPLLTNSIGMRLALVSPGVFLMGSPPDEAERHDDEHQHEVEITRPFYAGIHPVTQEQYQRVMDYNPSSFSSTGIAKGKVEGLDTRQFPVEKVPWEEAVEFCRRLSALPEEKAKERVYCLPTEAEWEYLCRGGPIFKAPPTAFSFGNSLSSEEANFCGNSPYEGAAKGPALNRTTPVGSYPSNVLGLYDMHGNVLEWCADWYGAEYYRRSPRQDPQGPKRGKGRVFRGGSWSSTGSACRSACRHYCEPDLHLGTGFRVVLLVGARGRSIRSSSALWGLVQRLGQAAGLSRRG
jgi:formylglycine-generating enzyme required for sulfatase activity